MRVPKIMLAPWGIWAARLAILAAMVGVAVAASSTSTTEGHGGHPQKKLFGGHWYHVDDGVDVDITTANFFYGLGYDYDGDTDIDNCDGGLNVGSCVSKWQTPFENAVNDWNAQPM